MTKRVQPHPLRAIWKAGRPALTSWHSLPGSYLAEAMAQLDWDCMVVDMQHGMIGFADAVQMMQGIEAAGKVAMIRLPWNEPGLAQRLLDAGARGLICPMVNDREECEQFVHACQYPPVGYRSFGGARSSSYYGEIGEMFSGARESILVFAMIETKTGMENREEIANVEGLDGIFFGPADYSASCGRSPSIGVNDEFIEEAHVKIVDLCNDHGLIAGINAATPDAFRLLSRRGYRFLPLASDLGIVMQAGATTIAEARSQTTTVEGANLASADPNKSIPDGPYTS